MVAKHFRVEKDAKEVALDDIDTRHVSFTAFNQRPEHRAPSDG